MGLLIGLIWLLIYIAVIAAVVYLLEWGLGQLFPNYPRKVMQVIWVIAVLIALAMVIQFLAGVVDLPSPIPPRR